VTLIFRRSVDRYSFTDESGQTTGSVFTGQLSRNVRNLQFTLRNIPEERICKKLHHIYIHVTVHRNKLLFKQPIRRTDYTNLFCYKTLNVSGIFSAHHQEFSIVHLALVSFIQGFDDRFQAESGWNCSSILTLLGSGHQKPV